MSENNRGNGKFRFFKSVDEGGWFQSLFRIGVIYFIGFSFFFFAAFLVIKVRISTSVALEVPSLIGKSYIAEHNRLSNLGFEVEIEEAALAEYPHGYILSQNLQPGSMTKSGASLVLLVNGSKPLVPVPRLVGSQEGLARTMLQNIPVGATLFSLKVGTVTAIASDRPAGEVLAQDPPEGAIVAPETPVSLLVSAKSQKVSQRFAPAETERLSVQLLKSWAYHDRVPLLIKTDETKNFMEDGLVKHVVQKKTGGQLIWEAKVLHYHDTRKQFYPNRVIWVETERNKVTGNYYTVAVENGERPGTYDEVAYLAIGDLLPLFLRSKANVYFWPGYVEVKTGEEQSTKIQEKKDGRKLPRPEFTVSLESVSI